MPRNSGSNPPPKKPKKARPNLKLVVFNPDPICAPAPTKRVPPVSQAAPPKEGFFFAISHKGPHLYGIFLQDPSHYLNCALDLEVQESEGTVVCYFPSINDDLLNQFIEWDEALYGMLVIQSQMKALEALLFFCDAHAASKLVIYMDDREARKFGVYHHFLSHCGRALTPRGQKTELVIPSDPQACAQWVNFMAKAGRDFRMALWREQPFNRVIRSYLKWDPGLQFFF